MRHIAPAATALALAAVLLTGCSVTYRAPVQGAPSHPAGDATAEPSSADLQTPTPNLRADFGPKVQKALTCQGDGSLTVDGISEVVSVSDDCGSVTVDGNSLVVLAQHVGSLTVSGIDCRVVVTTADTITVDGNANLVEWESGNPKITETGLGNSLVPAQR